MQLLKLGIRPKRPGKLMPVRHRSVGGEVLLTTAFGDWVFVSEAERDQLFRGELSEGSALEARLRERGFLADHVDPATLAARMRRKKAFLRYGPNLHVLVVTLRCNETCVYCHASRAAMDRVDTDMSRETAEKCVDLALRSTAPRITIEFQGGEPLANFPVVEHAIEYALAKNRAYGKELEFTMVSNLSLMTDERLDYLVGKKVQICTSIDGPPTLHDKQRVLAGGSAFAQASGWIRKLNQRYGDMGLDPTLYHVEALITVTRAALDYPREIVDTYLELGCRALFMRPLDPFGFASETGHKIEYERRSYLDFYREAVDYMLEKNAAGAEILERYAAIFLTKILTEDDPNFLDIRSPCGAGIGQLAYNYDGRMFTCDEGRMLHEMGDDLFRLGHVDETKYRELMTHETVRSIMAASNLDTQPDCVSCTYAAYCGICPVHNYETQGSLHGRMRESDWCAVHKGIQDYLFDKLRQNDPAVVSTLERWTTSRERSHFLQQCAVS
ncbi:MAG: His-Xaa-Ser system radical SAM maturase HxsB [Myxococcales bacterium]|nr:His-Xaa-Ser system radical SAM maturase HxsB [Myxococcales bacterium]